MNPPSDPVVKEEAKVWRGVLTAMMDRPFHDSNTRQRKRAIRLLYRHIRKELLR